MKYSSHYETIQNKELFKYKVHLINNIENSNSFRYSFSISYLGVPIEFKHNFKDFQVELEEFFPENWQSLSTDDPYVFHLYEAVSLAVDSFENEPSQDCVTYYEDSYYGVQRDFVASEKNKLITAFLNLKIDDGFFNLLRWFLPLKILKLNKAILHSSCVVKKNGKAVFFLGHSGAGKSTIALMSEGRHVLGDDMNLISSHDGKLYASAGVLGGLFFEGVDFQKKFEVEALYWLDQSPLNSSSQLSQSEAFMRVITSFANLFWEDLQDADQDIVFSLAREIIEQVNVYHLKFTKSESIWGLIDGETEEN